VRPMTPTDDQCPRYLQFAEPDPNQVEKSVTVDLANGVPSTSLKGIPTGFQTMLVKVTNAQSNLILHGCRTGSIDFGVKFEISLVSVTGPPPDFAVQDAAIDMTPPDMAQHKILNFTAVEIRQPTRKLQGVVIVLKDSTGTTVTLPATDVAGLTTIDTVGMTPPFLITASAQPSAGYAGATSLSGVSPTWGASGTLSVTLPIELDPPVTSAANAITVTVPDGAGQNFAAHYIGTNGLLQDQATLAWSGAAAVQISPLQAGSFRVAVLDSAANKVSTTNALLSAAQSYMPQLTGGTMPGDFKAYAAAFSLGVVRSTNVAYTTQQYSVRLVLPASLTQASIPIFPSTTFAANGTVNPTPVPAMPGTIQAAAVLMTEMTATGSSARGEIRHQLASPTPAMDSFPSAVPDPPAVTALPSPLPVASDLTITATPPGSFPISSAFLHVVIHDTAAAQKYHWHLIAPAGNPTTIVAAANVVPAGTYSVDIAFVEDFTLADGTVQATLTDDYTKLIRVVPQQLAQTTVALTVN
jgi:hypothetical protein